MKLNDVEWAVPTQQYNGGQEEGAESSVGMNESRENLADPSVHNGNTKDKNYGETQARLVDAFGHPLELHPPEGTQAEQYDEAPAHEVHSRAEIHECARDCAFLSPDIFYRTHLRPTPAHVCAHRITEQALAVSKTLTSMMKPSRGQVVQTRIQQAQGLGRANALVTRSLLRLMWCG